MQEKLQCVKCQHPINDVTKEDVAILAIISGLETQRDGKSARKLPVHRHEWEKIVAKYADETGAFNYQELMKPDQYFHGFLSLPCHQCHTMNHLFSEVYLTPRGMGWDIVITEDQEVRDEMAMLLDVTNQRLLPYLRELSQRQSRLIRKGDLSPSRLLPTIRRHLHTRVDESLEIPSVAVLLCNETYWNDTVYILTGLTLKLDPQTYTMEEHQQQYSFATEIHKLLLQDKESFQPGTGIPSIVDFINLVENKSYVNKDYLIFIRKEGIERDCLNPLREGIMHVVENIIKLTFLKHGLQLSRTRTRIIDELVIKVTAEIYTLITASETGNEGTTS